MLSACLDQNKVAEIRAALAMVVAKTLAPDCTHLIEKSTPSIE
mgnify:CR=1 FL=1